MVAVKLLKVPHDAHERCTLARLYSEVAILEHCHRARDVGVCRMFAYGVTEEWYWLVLERCECTLKQWCTGLRGHRESGTGGHGQLSLATPTPEGLSGNAVVGVDESRLPTPTRYALLMLRLFRCVVAAVGTLHERGVTHFDLKCDNVMLRRRPELDDTLEVLQSLVCIVDFGESVFTPGKSKWARTQEAVLLFRVSH